MTPKTALLLHTVDETFISILSEIMNERTKQDSIYGQQNHTPIEWVAILGEEFGEVSKEALDYRFYNPDQHPDVLHEINKSEILLRYKNELIQVAAVSIAMLQSLHRNELKDN